MRITPASELLARCGKLQERMASAGFDAVLMIQNADLFYFTGSIQQGALYVPLQGEPIYMVRKDHGRARMECGLREVVPFKSPKDIPALLKDQGLPMAKSLGMELDVVPVALFQRFHRVFEGATVAYATPLIRTVRAVKSYYEICIMMD
ncbi:MAG: aminopeptidase P family N-terminal domain-containing protein, partial [Desulfuromonadaceae bacterium]